MLYQIYYREDQLSKLYPFAVPYFNNSLTIFFENDPISKLVMSHTGEKIAVCSWKLSKKVRIIHPVTQDVIDSDYQVLSFTRNSHRHQMMAMANAWHPGFIATIDKLWQKIGLKRPPEAKNPIYQNHFSAKTEIYRDYVSNFLIPAMEVTSTDEELNKLMTQPSGYGRLSRSADMKSVKAKLGMDDYPLAPFILERCPSLYFATKGYKISYV
jgi:hypothetical protein